MPRARRHFIPGYIWHITHRCHKKEFLLRFAKVRQRWMHWLFKAKKRYGLGTIILSTPATGIQQGRARSGIRISDIENTEEIYNKVQNLIG